MRRRALSTILGISTVVAMAMAMVGCGDDGGSGPAALPPVTTPSISISPTSASMSTGGSKSFTATVTGTSNTNVTWSIVESGGGSVTSTGVYTAPSSAGTYHVKATSVANTTKSATATVTVSASTPFPIGTWVGPHNITITVNAFVDTIGFNNYYSGSVSYPAFSGGIVTVSGSIIDAGGSINYVQNNALAVFVQSVNGTSVTNLSFTGDGTIDFNMIPPITSLSGQLITVSTIPGNSFTERATFVKQ